MRRSLLIGLVLALAALLWPWSVGAQPGPAQPSPLHLLGQFSFESRRTFQDTTVGGLSGIAYDERRGVYYAICDDRGEQQAPRFYTLQIDLDPGASPTCASSASPPWTATPRRPASSPTSAATATSRRSCCWPTTPS